MGISPELSVEQQHQIHKLYPKAKLNVLVDSFPAKCAISPYLETRGQAELHSCGLEVALLALELGGIPIREREEIEVAEMIGLSSEGTDPLNMYLGLLELGLDCRLLMNHQSRSLQKSLVNNLDRVVYIWLGQQVAYARDVNDVLQALVGHYMLASFADKKYIYFADPGYARGKCRYSPEHLDPFWFDTNSSRHYKGLAIEVPVKINQ